MIGTVQLIVEHEPAETPKQKKYDTMTLLDKHEQEIKHLLRSHLQVNLYRVAVFI